MTLAALRRSRDTASIGLALAILLLLNSLAAGLVSGIAGAAEATGVALCGTGHDGSASPASGGRVHDHDCCMPAMSAVPLAAPPTTAPIPAAAAAAGTILTAVLPTSHFLLAAKPRGPPLV